MNSKPSPEEIKVFQTIFNFMELSKRMTREGDPPDGTSVNAEGTVGSTRFRILAVDSQILSEMPASVAEGFKKVPDENSVLSLDVPATGHVRVWMRLSELNPKVGRYLFIEVIPDLHEIKSDPDGKSARCYRRIMAMIAAYANSINPAAWKEFVRTAKTV